jgi:16S rRNA (cytosine1402-N4)-methyltransferase
MPAEASGAGTPFHPPALAAEVADLPFDKEGLAVDATLGTGGHALALLSRYPRLRVVGIDRDPEALRVAASRLAGYSERVKIVQARFSSLGEIVDEPPSLVLFDLGVSLLQLLSSGRGFSFDSDDPLDMRMGPDCEMTAATVVNTYSRQELLDLFVANGEPFSRASAVVEAILTARPIRTTGELARLIASRVGRVRGRLHPATRFFQALRREVNCEDEELRAGLVAAAEVVAPGGIVAVISYHEAEDRVVKEFFLRLASAGASPSPSPGKSLAGFDFPLGRKVIRPTREEVAANRRARSARMRVIRRVGPQAETSALGDPTHAVAPRVPRGRSARRERGS